MGKITNALKKAAEERIDRIDKISRIKKRDDLVVKKIGESTISPSIVTYFDHKSLISEQYKILRTNLLSMNSGKRAPTSIAITSAIYNEGKTITALNLAFSLAQEVHKPKVLLIDADLRKGRVAKYLGAKQEVGLTEVLNGECEISDAVFHLDEDNLAFIESGRFPENPSELLGSETMKGFLMKMRGQFDFVIVDTPPIISVTDAGIVGAQCDGVLMIVQAGRTQRGMIRRAEELLTQSHTNIIGHVLTNIEYHLPEYIYRYL